MPKAGIMVIRWVWERRAIIVALVVMVIMGGCGSTTTGPCSLDCPLPTGCHYEAAAPGAVCSCGTLVCSDAGPSDASAVTDAAPTRTDVACGIDCASPPPGCSYVGGSPCSCGTLMCEGPDAGADGGGVLDAVDAGGSDAGAVDSACPYLGCPVTMGCHYVPLPQDSGCGCGTLVCDDAGTPIVCGAGTSSSFPTFDRSCTMDSDCFVALHQTDCCGSTRAMGLNVAQRAAFTAAEATCDRMYPACECDARSPETDDGMYSTGVSMIVVHCLAGMCSTTLN